MKKKIISVAVSAVVCVTAMFNVMAATEENTSDKVDPVTPTQVVGAEMKNHTDKRKIKVTLNKNKVRKETGKAFKLNAKINKKGYKAQFTSTNKKVAVVNRKGVVKTKNAGTVRIIAKCKGVKDVCKVKVVQAGNSIKDSTMKNIVSKIGRQVDRAYYSSSIMCSAYSFAYAYKQVTGKTITPGSVWSSGGCTWNGGTYNRYSSSTSMLNKIKSEIDNNRACVGYLYQSSGPHYVTFYSYTGDGADLSDYTVMDPWDGTIKNAGQFGICAYHVVTIN